MIRKVDSNIKNFIEARNIYVLRDKTTGNALHVSYTEDGLKYATNPITGKLVYYSNAKFERRYDKEGNILRVDIGGDLTMNPNVYVEKFIPTDHTILRSQLAEYTAVDRGYRLLYTSYYNSLPA
jgi:hypothetical protein